MNMFPKVQEAREPIIHEVFNISTQRRFLAPEWRGTMKKNVILKSVAAVLALLSAGCVDPGAVTSFASLAPDANKLHSLTVAYADAPTKLEDLDVLHRIAPMYSANIAAQVKARNEQVMEIDALHAVLVNYMASLGALADNALVQTSTDTAKVTDGLTALSKAKPNLGLTSGIISGVGKICTLLADAATAGYRQSQLTGIIGRSESSFQALVMAERLIVTEGVIKELKLVKDKTADLAEVTHALQVNNDAEAALAKPPKPGATGVDGLDPRLQQSGAADTASLYLLQQAIRADLASIDLQIQAATAYVTALDKIAAAHTVLYNNRNGLLTRSGAKSAITQLMPLVKEANSALQSLKSM
jgi:hypothetical protein